MKAILFSADFETCEAGVAELERLTGKPAAEINFAVINEACAVEEGDDNSFFVDTMAYLKKHFGKVYLVNLLALPLDAVKRRIERADAVFCCGGHTEYLQTVLEKTGLAGALPELLENTVWCGSSAGSMVVGRMVPAEWQERLYGEWDDYGVTEYLRLVDFAVLPHLTGGDLASNETDKVAYEISRALDFEIYALSDWSAVVVDGDERRAIGDGWTVLRGGEELGRDDGKKIGK